MKPSTIKRVKLTTALIVLVSCFIIVNRFIDIEDLVALLGRVQENPWAPFIYIALYIVGVVFALPGLALTVIAGPIFGFWKGTLLVVIASNIGCQMTFWISRWLGQEFVERFIRSESFLEKVSDKIERNGFMVMLYLRLIPLFPFNAINYLSGLTSIKHRDYTIATFVGMLPATMVYVYLSASAAEIKDNPLGLIVSVVVLIVFTVATTMIKRRQKLLNEEEIDDRQ